MQSLVDYGSDSDDETPTGSAVSVTASIKSGSSSSFLNLPPPKVSTASTTPATLSSSKDTITTKKPLPALPPKKAKGPVRILLDLPPPSTSSSSSPSASTSTPSNNDNDHDGPDGPIKKKPKLTLGGSLSGSGGGLAALLPKPKNQAPPPMQTSGSSTKPLSGGGLMGRLPPPASSTVQSSSTAVDSSEGGKTGPSGGFLPNTLANKGKAKATNGAVAETKPAQRDPGLDFFGLGESPRTVGVHALLELTLGVCDSGSVASSAPSHPSATLSSSRLSKPTMTISSAPTPIAVPVNSASKTPTASDPYPGFTQLPSGEWVAKDQETYDLWVQSMVTQQQQAQEVPKEFIDATRQGKILDLHEEQERAKKAWADRPEQLPSQEWQKKGQDEEAQAKVPLKPGQYRARQKGQLSALLADAVENRAELEERIARGKANRKAAGNRYGF
ncbi:BZ3500_MvSof-1268-A1-R1_Chr9g10387 [Microbotryum saponariae]|uniref:BZ3500_MvSof-1268-A1-R1_Chr9g10387 protein n=1 Tax=Microbotryum saponariae TaxID=289078 RepID=A0A2X0LLV0_9BASI|nr:BZ3501_MvSof-1269-A2-R1_Chr9g10137 [Microbotryum saponariae]SDA00003.1 BZ3500_MvSof-1268-A1-R1_Chr9g10387 [Microbotryum saponariae]